MIAARRLKRVGDQRPLAPGVDEQRQHLVEVVHALLGAGLGRLLVVMTARQRQVLPDASLTDIIEVKPLTDDEADQLIVALKPGLSDDARAAVRHRCDGVPLYIAEVVTKVNEQSTNKDSL